MWREAASQAFGGTEFQDPAQEAALVAAEELLGGRLPAELRKLLLETNGVIGHSGVDTVWSIGQIIEQNLSFRTDASLAGLYMPFDPLLFFGDNGGGDQFAFVQSPERPDIFVWEHETDSRRWVAGHLKEYLERSLREGGDEWYQ
ncbi:SMI1/KNR4 family protein [Streptomyces xanthochromogenes]|uniref:SMI1/KNR4 family protein n=1 Tax=Streptomyces xanthochromogenes TaxID=67384 RepID=UPI00381C242C